MFRRLWRARQRTTDIEWLWPSVCNRASSLERARADFAAIVLKTQAWRALGSLEALRQILALQFE